MTATATKTIQRISQDDAHAFLKAERADKDGVLIGGASRWFGYFEDGVLIGCAAMTDYRHYAKIGRLFVISSRRRQGIGFELLKHAISTVPNKPVRGYANERSEHLNERLGFAYVKTFKNGVVLMERPPLA
jgi:GNAT superfamily N-acetyltransferase